MHLFSVRKSGLVLLASVFLNLPLAAATNQRLIDAAVANVGVTQSSLGNDTGASLTRNGGGTYDSFASNNIEIHFTADAVKTVPGALSLSNNTMTMKNGDYSFNGDQSAARVILRNDGGAATADVSQFQLDLLNNVVSVDHAALQNSSGNLVGALFHSINATMGNSQVNGNQVNLTTNTNAAITPTIIGGAASTYVTRKNLNGQSSVINNSVTIDTHENYEFLNSIFGGYNETIITEELGHKSYVLNDTIDGNQVTLKNGKFFGNITGGKTFISTDNKNYTATLSGNVQNNQITVQSGTVSGAVLIGGHASIEGSGLSNSSSLPITVHDNKITISGGKFYDTLIIGGVATNPIDTKGIEGTVTNNVIEISGTPDFHDSTTLLGGYSSGTGAVSNNTLSLKTKNVTVYGADNFSTYQFDVAAANSGDTFLTVTHGDGHDHSFFSQYEKNFVPRRALNLEGVNIQWTDSTQAEQGRPSNLQIGNTLTLINSTSSSDVRGTIANNGAQTDIASGGDTYSYKVVQAGNQVYLLHNGFATPGNWTQNISITAPQFAGGDSFMNIGGTLTASSITVNGNDAATASLHAAALDVSAQNTLLNLNQTAANQVKFDTINVGNGQTLLKIGNGFYTFDTMTIDGSGSVPVLDAMSATTTVTLTGGANPTFDQINLGNASTLSVSGGAYNFNTLNVYANSNTISGDLNGASKAFNFYLADTTQKTDTILTVTGNADVTDSTIQIGINGESSPLKKDDNFVLLQSATLTGTPATQTGVGMQGLLLSYDFDVEAVGNQLVATVTKAGLSKESKVFLEGRAASLAFVGEGGDFIADNAVESALQAAALREDKALALFTAFGGGQSRYETGSHIKNNGWNATVGLSHDVTIFSMETVLASFIEYGNGSYNTYNNFASGNLNGSGKTEYIGLGALGNWLDPKYNTYCSMSLRIGSVSTDFKAPVFFADRNATYDYSTLYYGGHFGVGYLYEISAGTKMDFYARYMATQQQGKKVTISSGDRLRFSNSLSSRVRTGLKTDIALSSAWSTVLGAAYDYEFGGKAKAEAYDMSWDAPSLKGGTVIGEIGLAYGHENWSFGIGAEGYAGERRGFSGNLQIGHKF